MDGQVEGEVSCENGKWTPVPYCLPTCESDPCPPGQLCRMVHALPQCFTPYSGAEEEMADKFFICAFHILQPWSLICVAIKIYRLDLNKRRQPWTCWFGRDIFCRNHSSREDMQHLMTLYIFVRNLHIANWFFIVIRLWSSRTTPEREGGIRKRYPRDF